MYINKNSVNPFICELTLISSFPGAYYLFEMINDLNPSQITYWTGQDLSPYACRFNRFDIIETGSTYVNLTASTMNLRSGSYTYNVYEATGLTLQVSGTTGRIISQNNKAVVNGEDTEYTNVYR